MLLILQKKNQLKYPYRNPKFPTTRLCVCMMVVLCPKVNSAMNLRVVLWYCFLFEYSPPKGSRSPSYSIHIELILTYFVVNFLFHTQNQHCVHNRLLTSQ